MPRGHRARFVAQLIVVVLAAALAALLVESVLPVRARRRALTSASSESAESYFLWLVARAGWKLNREIGWLLLAGQLAFIVYSTLTFYVIEVPF